LATRFVSLPRHSWWGKRPDFWRMLGLSAICPDLQRNRTMTPFRAFWEIWHRLFLRLPRCAQIGIGFIDLGAKQQVRWMYVYALPFFFAALVFLFVWADDLNAQ